MRLIDFYPSQGSFSPGEAVTFLIELEVAAPEDLTFQIRIGHLDERAAVIQQTSWLAMGKQTVQVKWIPPSQPAGYSARLEFLSESDSPTFGAVTAFDVLSHWTDFPRYGFLTDFSVLRADPGLALEKLTRFHINGLQFYDWQYRHDQLLASTEEYIDPLGREMSLTSVRKLVDAAHQHGMAAMPYLAIYAASADFWRAHPDGSLYDEEGKPIAFGENFLGLMDPSAGSSWSQHLLDECARVLENIPFDGLHIDQYGDPKRAWNVNHVLVDLPGGFVDFIRSASDEHPGKTILFNAVGNWPIEALADSALDFLYIEVWPPDMEYRHLAEIVLNAVRLSHGKPVVIALYLPANRPANNLLADAVILACGGTRIELGEDARLLSDPYFPKHEGISPELQSDLRKFYDFAIRNGEWLGSYTLSPEQRETWAVSELNPSFVEVNDSLWVVLRRYPGAVSIRLVNFAGLSPRQQWDHPHLPPTRRENILVQVRLTRRPHKVFYDCPEEVNGLQGVTFGYQDGILKFELPRINYIGLVLIHG